ncbi:MAG: septum formation initiator [Acidobacterium ailaaui]|nr:septum formation initiator [Pseudacidobacterium ailaaui]
MRGTVILIFLFANVNVFAQTDTLTKEDLDKALQSLKTSIQTLQKENGRLKSDIRNLNSRLLNANKSIDSLRNITMENSSAILQKAKELSVRISQTETDSNQKITKVDNLLSKNTIYGIIGILSAFLISIVLYLLLSKRQITDKSELVDNIQKTKSSIEDKLVNQFYKQTELLENQFQLLLQQKNNTLASVQEPDHSLALKVANEINLIERNLALMDSNIKGYKQLKKSIEKLKDNLNANGYEIIDLLGKTYHPGLPVTIINSFPDENIEKNLEIISKILVPAVRYNDRIIQTAQVEVNVGV